MPAIRAELNQSLVRGGQCLPRADVAQRVTPSPGALGVHKEERVSVAFVTAAEIRRLNRQYRGKDKVTDVLSFTLNDGDLRGEILLCYPQARKQAEELGHGVREELLFLIVHGLLHLHGFDHETPRDARRMFPLQKRILDGLGIDSRLCTLSACSKSFRHALRGVAVAFEQELSFCIQFVAGVAVLSTAWVLKVRPTEWIVLIFLVGAVLTLELINSVFERLADAWKPRLHPVVRDVKDLMAGTVLLTSLAAAVIGALIFFPYLQAYL